MRAPARHPCPICGREAPPPGRHDGGDPHTPGPAGTVDNRSFPFCSPACKLVDLGRWLEGSYSIPGPPAESSLDVDEGDLPSYGDPRRFGRDGE